MFQEKQVLASTGKNNKFKELVLWKWLALAISLSVLLFWNFRPKSKLSFEVPLHFPKSEFPCIYVTIEGHDYLLELDSGSTSYFSLNTELINSIKDKKPGKETKSYDIKGREYFSPSFSIKKIEIGKIYFQDIMVKEEDPNFLFEGSVLYSPISDDLKEDYQKIYGRVGAGFFKANNYWLLDFPNSRIVAIRNLDEYIKRISSNNFAEVQLENFDALVVIRAKTDIGEKTFLIDTGSNRSIIRPPQELGDGPNRCIISNKFIIGGKDFGKTKLALFNMTHEFKFDGIIGRDFLKNHPIFIDLENQRALIGAI